MGRYVVMKHPPALITKSRYRRVAMSGNAKRRTIVVWVGEEDEKLDDRLERRLSYGDSMSGYAKDALRLRFSVDDALSAAGQTFESERQKRAWVKQAIIDHAGRDAPA